MAKSYYSIMKEKTKSFNEKVGFSDAYSDMKKTKLPIKLRKQKKSKQFSSKKHRKNWLSRL